MPPLAFLFLLVAQGAERVGPTAGGTLVAIGQLVRPAGDVASFPGRPVDLVVAGKFVYVKDNRGVQHDEAGAPPGGLCLYLPSTQGEDGMTARPFASAGN